MEKLLEIRDLYAQYKTEDGVVYAVNGIDLDIVQGETLGLLGETGAGKTTTALSILRLLPERTGSITSGSIKINGMDITRAKVNMYVTPDYDISGDRAFTELFGDVHPLCTLIVVNGLFRKELLIEIEMTAIIGCNTEEDQVTLL